MINFLFVLSLILIQNIKKLFFLNDHTVLRNFIPSINHKLFMWDFYVVITTINFLMIKYYN